jgi:hypothetical protein
LDWQATVTNLAVIVAVVGLLSAAAYLSAQAITSIKPRPHRAHSATLTVALSGLRANGSRTTAIAGAVAVPVAVAVLLSGFLVALNRGLIASELSGLLGTTNKSRQRRWQLSIDAVLDGLAQRVGAVKRRR